jgi:hypothetical protein
MQIFQLYGTDDFEEDYYDRLGRWFRASYTTLEAAKRDVGAVYSSPDDAVVTWRQPTADELMGDERVQLVGDRSTDDSDDTGFWVIRVDTLKD